jgi:hypothetical protein
MPCRIQHVLHDLREMKGAERGTGFEISNYRHVYGPASYWFVFDGLSSDQLREKDEGEQEQ